MDDIILSNRLKLSDIFVSCMDLFNIDKRNVNLHWIEKTLNNCVVRFLFLQIADDRFIAPNGKLVLNDIAFKRTYNA